MLEASREAIVSELISSLQKIQLRLGYIPQEAIQWLAEEMHLSEQDVYGVATFYKNFRFTPPGKHQLKMCMGTACFVQGGRNNRRREVQSRTSCLPWLLCVSASSGRGRRGARQDDSTQDVEAVPTD
jgi:NADH:ubiquinone oxidoreductase subunit E